MKIFSFFITIFFFLSFTYSSSSAKDNQTLKPTGQFLVLTKIENFYDQKQNRLIPVELYWPGQKTTTDQIYQKLNFTEGKIKTIEGFHYAKAELEKIKINSQSKLLKIVLINPGNEVAMTDYSYLATELASYGFFVVCIENQLKSDPKLIVKKTLAETRMPAWQRGVDNNLAVIKELKSRDFADHLDFSNITLIGHSLGGDMVMLFAKEHPKLLTNLISLDNLRIEFPNQKKPKMLILRNQERQYDSVTKEDLVRAQRYGHKLVFIKNSTHRQFSDEGTFEVKTMINREVISFLNGSL